METQEAIITRRTIHSYKAEPLPEGVLQRALEAAHHAPNHKLTFPWRFLIIGPESREKVADIHCRLKSSDCSPEIQEQTRRKMLNPGVLVAVTCKRNSDAFRAREDYAAATCAIQNFMLSLTDQGYGSKWSTGGSTRDSETYKLLGVNPEAEEVIGFIMGGTPVAVPPPIKRPPLEAHVSRLP